jgi:hypothetical protein
VISGRDLDDGGTTDSVVWKRDGTLVWIRLRFYLVCHLTFISRTGFVPLPRSAILSLEKHYVHRAKENFTRGRPARIFISLFVSLSARMKAVVTDGRVAHLHHRQRNRHSPSCHLAALEPRDWMIDRLGNFWSLPTFLLSPRFHSTFYPTHPCSGVIGSPHYSWASQPMFWAAHWGKARQSIMSFSESAAAICRMTRWTVFRAARSGTYCNSKWKV